MKLPPIAGGARFWSVTRLIGYGVAHAAVVFVLALLVRHGLHTTPGTGLTGPLALGILGLTGILFGLRVLEARDAEALGQDYVIRVRRRILESTMRRAWNRSRQQRWGVTMSRLVTDLNSLRNWVSLGLARMISSGVALLGLLATLAVFHPPTAGVMLAVVGALLFGNRLLLPALRRRVREVRKHRGRLANRAGEQILAALTNCHLGRQERELHRVFRDGRRLRDATVRRATVGAVLRRSPELGHGLAIVALLHVIASPALPKFEGASGAAVMLFLIGLVIAAMRDLARAWDYRIAFEEGRRRVARLLSEPVVRVSPQARPLAGDGPVGVVFEAVQWHSDHLPWSFEAAPGERVVIVGASGAGKSMLLRQAARLLDPTSGRVLLDGLPLPEVKDLHRVVQLVSPEVPLLRGTVRHNLEYGLDPGGTLTVQDVAEALGMLGESPLFPEGLNTWVAEGGHNLPAGARARSMLGRALLAKPRLLLLDDPAFLLDAGTGRVLRQALPLVRATVLLVGAEPPWPIVPNSVWRLSGSGGCIERAGAAQPIPARMPQ